MLAQGGDAADRIAVEVLANVAAMEAAVELAGKIEALDARWREQLRARSRQPEVDAPIWHAHLAIGPRNRVTARD